MLLRFIRSVYTFYPDSAKLSCYLEPQDDNVERGGTNPLDTIDDPMLDDIVVDLTSKGYFWFKDTIRFFITSFASKFKQSISA